MQQLFGDCAGSHPADGLACTGAAAARHGADAVLEIVRGIGVGGAVRLLHLAVVLALLVLVAHLHGGGSGKMVQEHGSVLCLLCLPAGLRPGLALWPLLSLS